MTAPPHVAPPVGDPPVMVSASGTAIAGAPTSLLQSTDCNPNPYQKEASEWIRGNQKVTTAAARRRIRAPLLPSTRAPFGLRIRSTPSEGVPPSGRIQTAAAWTWGHRQALGMTLPLRPLGPRRPVCQGQNGHERLGTTKDRANATENGVKGQGSLGGAGNAVPEGPQQPRAARRQPPCCPQCAVVCQPPS